MSEIRVGDFVKFRLQTKRGGEIVSSERIWAEVLSIDTKAQLVELRLDNTPVGEGFNLDDVIEVPVSLVLDHMEGRR